MTHASSDKLLQEWAKNWKTENLSLEIRKLIGQANYDLWYGPCKNGAYGDPAEGDEEWDSYPGFTKACDAIEHALRVLPSDLYFDADTGEVLEKKPEAERCEDCQGEGSITETHPTVETTRAVKCSACNGLGCFDADGDWWHIERNDIRVALVGQELSNYIR